MDADLCPGFSLEEIDDVDIIVVTGEVDLASAPELEALIESRLPEKRLIIDLTGCLYLDSSTLTVFVRAYKARGATLRLVVPDEARIRRLFAMTKLDEVLSVLPSRAAAIA